MIVIVIRTACRDGRHEDGLLQDGFVIVALLDPDELTRVRQGVLRLGFGKDDGTGFPVPRWRLRNSITQGDPELANRIFVDLSPMLQDAASRILREYALLRIGIFDKLPGGVAIEAHQHATIVDESTYRSLAVWLPLADTSVEMGTLHVVKGSHEFTHGLRPKNLVRDGYSRVSRRVMNRHSTPVLLRAGEAIIFDDRLIHWSPPNRSSRIRTALQLELIPEEAELVMYYRTSEHDLVKYAVKRSVFRENWLTQEDPEKLSHLEKLTQPAVHYGNSEFVAMVGGARFVSATQTGPLFSRVVSGIRDRTGF